METKINDRLYSWASDIDDGTIRQAERTARLPIIHDHVALMPDAHVGMGATVGSVIPTEGAIIPSAVGVDIGCVDAATEYLSPWGWRPICSYRGEDVVQFHPETGMASWTQPLRYVRREQKTFFHFKTKYGVDQMLTPDHRVLCWRIEGRDRHTVQQVVSASDFVADHERLVLGNKSQFETAFTLTGNTGIPLSNEQLRVQVMFMADGCITSKTTGVVKLNKERKIVRARKLLDDAGISYIERMYGDNSLFRFIPPVLVKSYDALPWPSTDQAEVIATECLEWDGSTKDRVFFTRDLYSADYIQLVFSMVGCRSVLRADENGDGSVDYRVFSYTNSRIAMAGTPKSPIREVSSVDGYAYCFTVPSGFLVLRRNGNIFTTGNCGMIAAQLNVSAASLPDNLERLLPLIEKAVPAGVGQGHDRASQLADAWLAEHKPNTKLSSRQAETSAKQFGTLGSGNHFFEVCLDENDQVWIVLHSGSRGIGNQLAQVHITKAKKMARDLELGLEDPDLAYFTQDQPEFGDYLTDMLWAQDYAMANRAQMMARGSKVVLGALPAGARVVDTINCHHNFTAPELFNGKNLFITRKGAIRAQVGDRGVIPGSMGTSSYIVTGLGNKNSWNSCAHGAGRRMSRGEARRTFNSNDLKAAMGDRVWLKDRAKQLVDEIPQSYKSIETVMDDQKDLVRVDHTLRSCLNYKGTK